MHPDAILAGLKRELESVEAADKDRRAQIEAEIAETEKLPRPESKPEERETVVDRAVGYLAGLKRELERAAESRRAEITAEIKRVETAIRARGDTGEPAEKVERATAVPGETRTAKK